jgi:hypothetical protein
MALDYDTWFMLIKLLRQASMKDAVSKNKPDT